MSVPAKRVLSLLRRNGSAMTMRQIITHLKLKEPNLREAIICNAVHNNSNLYFTKKPAFKKEKIDGTLYFSLNK